jgi:AraC-like DNA-binding protein
MSLGSYARLRRLNLVRRSLQRADPAIGSVAAIAKQFGLSELGHFARHIGGVFGETLSATLWSPAKPS